MKKGFRSLKDWAVAFEQAAALLVEERVRKKDRGAYPFSAEPCAEHGPGCVCIVYGALKGHFEWAREDPAVLAEQLMGTMFPPPDQPAG